MQCVFGLAYYMQIAGTAEGRWNQRSSWGWNGDDSDEQSDDEITHSTPKKIFKLPDGHSSDEESVDKGNSEWAPTVT